MCTMFGVVARPTHLSLIGRNALRDELGKEFLENHYRKKGYSESPERSTEVECEEALVAHPASREGRENA